MIIIKSDQEIDIMRTAGKVTAKILEELKDFIKPGVSTMDIDRFVEEIIRKNDMVPSFKGLYDFPASACVSVNEEVVHGIPSAKRKLREGDIVSVDTGATYKGYVSDAARTYAVGRIDPEAQRLIDAAKDSFFEGLKFCRVGYRLSDISHAIQEKVESEGFGVIRDFVGHGVGRKMHEDPQIPNFGAPGRGPRLARGMVFAIEPMITQGSYEVETLLDNWTVVTLDGKLAAHYENSVVITDGEPELLTL
ncbi:type I methionyl aminopeptidase [Zhenpiania hominis]|uniref:Methionine aminopeptidase n=1 Tax=Zhenpiania hominis TaxID=2763644 RepID=A0A923NJJ9_9FIRM|nr:type I methionyl aminopeptidase [Zhenpiania hominis]MBC6680253.1 type I methionyl aminopeptidase [Zhenpiania hominis]